MFNRRIYYSSSCCKVPLLNQFQAIRTLQKPVCSNCKRECEIEREFQNLDEVFTRNNLRSRKGGFNCPAVNVIEFLKAETTIDILYYNEGLLREESTTIANDQLIEWAEGKYWRKAYRNIVIDTRRDDSFEYPVYEDMSAVPEQLKEMTVADFNDKSRKEFIDSVDSNILEKFLCHCISREAFDHPQLSEKHYELHQLEEQH